VAITRGDTGLFVEVRPALGERAFLTAGVRGERIARDSLVGDGFGRPPFDEDVVWSTNPKIGFAWFARPESAASAALGATKLRAHAGTGIKPPTAFDIAFTNNPDLKPERSRSYDVGVEQAFANSTVVADATFFDNRYEDLIVSVGTQLAGASRFRTDNIANAKAHGLETGVSWHTRIGVSVRGAWTFLHTETLAVDNLPSLAPQPYKVGDPLIRRPAQQGSLEIAWASSRANLFITVNGRGDMADIEPNFGATVFTNPGYTVVNFGGSIKLVHGVELTGRVLNAGDTQYEEALGFPALGRSAMIGVRVTAGR
jgi:outer membrane receptor protein involved in Fe transport